MGKSSPSFSDRELTAEELELFRAQTRSLDSALEIAKTQQGMSQQDLDYFRDIYRGNYQATPADKNRAIQTAISMAAGEAPTRDQFMLENNLASTGSRPGSASQITLLGSGQTSASNYTRPLSGKAIPENVFDKEDTTTVTENIPTGTTTSGGDKQIYNPSYTEYRYNSKQGSLMTAVSEADWRAYTDQGIKLYPVDSGGNVLDIQYEPVLTTPSYQTRTIEKSVANPSMYPNGQEILNAYQDILNRAPSSAGYAYWQGEINSGTITRDNLAVAISNGAGGGTDQALNEADRANAMKWKANYFAENLPDGPEKDNAIIQARNISNMSQGSLNALHKYIVSPEIGFPNDLLKQYAGMKEWVVVTKDIDSNLSFVELPESGVGIDTSVAHPIPTSVEVNDNNEIIDANGDVVVDANGDAVTIDDVISGDTDALDAINDADLAAGDTPITVSNSAGSYTAKAFYTEEQLNAMYQNYLYNKDFLTKQEINDIKTKINNDFSTVDSEGNPKVNLDKMYVEMVAQSDNDLATALKEWSVGVDGLSGTEGLNSAYETAMRGISKTYKDDIKNLADGYKKEVKDIVSAYETDSDAAIAKYGKKAEGLYNAYKKEVDKAGGDINKAIANTNSIIDTYRTNYDAKLSGYMDKQAQYQAGYEADARYAAQRMGQADEDLLAQQRGQQLAGISQAYKESQDQLLATMSRRGLAGTGVETTGVTNLASQEAMAKAGALSQSYNQAIGLSDQRRMQQLGISQGIAQSGIGLQQQNIGNIGAQTQQGVGIAQQGLQNVIAGAQQNVANAGGLYQAGIGQAGVQLEAGLNQAVQQAGIGMQGAQQGYAAVSGSKQTAYGIDSGLLSQMLGLDQGVLNQQYQANTANTQQYLANIQSGIAAGQGVYGGGSNMLAGAGQTYNQTASTAGQGFSNMYSANNSMYQSQVANANAGAAGIGSLVGTLGGAFLGGSAFAEIVK